MDKDFKFLLTLLKDISGGVIISDVDKRRRLLWDGTWEVLAQKTFSGSFSITLYSGPDLSEALRVFAQEDTK